MKQFIATLLICAVLGQSFNRVLLLASYRINKDFIAANLCENKTRPDLQCHGKCHLKKQLDKEDKKEKAPASIVKDADTNWQAVSPSRLDLSQQPAACVTFAPFPAGITAKGLTSVFHPPSV